MQMNPENLTNCSPAEIGISDISCGHLVGSFSRRDGHRSRKLADGIPLADPRDGLTGGKLARRLDRTSLVEIS